MLKNMVSSSLAAVSSCGLLHAHYRARGDPDPGATAGSGASRTCYACGRSRTSGHSSRSRHGTATTGPGRNCSTGSSRRPDLDSGLLELFEQPVRLGGWAL